MRRARAVVVIVVVVALAPSVGAPAWAEAPETVEPIQAPVGAPSAPASLPAAVEPARAVVAPVPAKVPLARRWWFWASLGGAAVAVIAAGILLSPPDPYRGNADNGIVTVF